MFALVDGNNFYVSCERVFRPSLKGRPVLVLSNNDGCAISRSNEAKALGIRMGAPYFEVRQKMPDAGVVALSANFVLYGDMSNRMMSIAAGLGPRQEIYSIDESFVDLSGVRGDLLVRGRTMRERILQWTGLPCGIGMGQTKTLAKLANHVAKTAERKPGRYPEGLAQVCSLSTLPASDLGAVLAATDLGEIWGIGPRIAKQLRSDGLSTALDVARMDPVVARRRWSVTVERTVRELQGFPCVGLDDAPAAKQEIACTRSFGRSVATLPPLIEAVSEFASRAAEKLRLQDGRCGQLLVFIHTSPFRDPDKPFAKSITMPLRRPTADTGHLVAAAVRGLKAIYKPGFNISKAGVMLLDLQDGAIEQQELDLDDDEEPRERLMAALDKVNDRYGKGTLKMASAGLAGDKRVWAMRQERRTPHYTTDWTQVPVAVA